MKDNNIFNTFGCLTEETIDAYIANELVGKKLDETEHHISICEFCADAVEGIKLSANHTHNISEIRKEIKYKIEPKAPLARRSNKIFILTSIAASILFIIGLFYIFNSKNDMQIIENITNEKNNRRSVYEPPIPKQQVTTQENINTDSTTTNNNLITKRLFSTNNEIKKPDFSNKVFTFTDEMPEFPGGVVALDKMINKEIEQAESSFKLRSCGKVYVEFLIDENGKVTNPIVIGKKKKKLDQIAIDIVKNLPKWKPGKQSGQAVKVSYTLPINFSKC